MTTPNSSNWYCPKCGSSQYPLHYAQCDEATTAAPAQPVEAERADMIAHLTMVAEGYTQHALDYGWTLGNLECSMLAQTLERAADLLSRISPPADSRDAARYRWLRDKGDGRIHVYKYDEPETLRPDNMDAAIDAAMQEPKP